eukprot:2482625-Pyramimonas_sp.AAC.1
MAATGGQPPGLEEGAAAVAAEGGAQAAVAASRADLDALPVTQSCKLNSIALKWVRDTAENPPGFPVTPCVDITDSDPMCVGVLERTTGMACSFRGGGGAQPWSWRQMLVAPKPD